MSCLHRDSGLRKDFHLKEPNKYELVSAWEISYHTLNDNHKLPSSGVVADTTTGMYFIGLLYTTHLWVRVMNLITQPLYSCALPTAAGLCWRPCTAPRLELLKRIHKGSVMTSSQCVCAANQGLAERDYTQAGHLITS